MTSFTITKRKKFLIADFRLATSFQGLNSSLVQWTREIWKCHAWWKSWLL